MNKMVQYSSYLEQLIKEKPRYKQQIINFYNRFTIIKDIIVDTELFNYTFRCKVPGCGLCCFAGTAVRLEEIKRIEPIIEQIKPYLNESNVRRLNKLDNRFYTKHRIAGFYKLRTWKGSCIFLMDNKLCSIHKYCLDQGLDFVSLHFDLCVTYPLRISREERIIHIENELYLGEYVYPCFNKREPNSVVDPEIDLVYYMKNVIVDRFGLDFWIALEKEFKASLETR